MLYDDRDHPGGQVRHADLIGIPTSHRRPRGLKDGRRNRTVKASARDAADRRLERRWGLIVPGGGTRFDHVVADMLPDGRPVFALRMDAGLALPSLAPPDTFISVISGLTLVGVAPRRNAHRRMSVMRLPRRAPDEDPRAQRPLHRLSDRRQIHRYDQTAQNSKRPPACCSHPYVEGQAPHRPAGSTASVRGISAASIDKLKLLKTARRSAAGTSGTIPAASPSASGWPARRHIGDHDHRERRNATGKTVQSKLPVNVIFNLGMSSTLLHLHADEAAQGYFKLYQDV